MKLKLLGIATAAALLAMAGASFAQSIQSESGPGIVVTPATPAAPNIAPGSSGNVSSGAPVGGLSKCENLLGVEKDKCLQDERAGTGSTSGRAAGAGGSHAPGSTGTGSGTSGAQGTAPSGTVR